MVITFAIWNVCLDRKLMICLKSDISLKYSLAKVERDFINTRWYCLSFD